MSYGISIEIAGCIQILYAGAEPLQVVQPLLGSPAGATTTALNALDMKTASAVQSEIPKFGGVGAAARFTVNAADRTGALSALFGRSMVGVVSVLLKNTLLGEQGTVAIEAIGNIAAFPAEGYLYIAQETIRYTSKDDNTSTFTLHPQGRGYLGTLAADHLVNNAPAQSYAPRIAAAPVFWAYRPAVIKVHPSYGGLLQQSGAVELLRGYLAAEPMPTTIGYRLTFVSALAAFDRHIGIGTEQTELVDGWYYCDGNRACKTTHYEVIPQHSITKVQGAGTNVTLARVAGNGAAGVIQCGDTSNMVACFATARGNHTGDPTQGRVLLDKQWLGLDAVSSVVSGYGPAPGTVALAEDNAAAVTAAELANPFNGSALRNARVIRNMHSPPKLTEGLHRWPDAIITQINLRLNTTLQPTGGLLYSDNKLNSAGTQLRLQDSGFAFDTENPPRLGPAQQTPNPAVLWYPLLRGIDEKIDTGNDHRRPLSGWIGQAVPLTSVKKRAFAIGAVGSATTVPFKAPALAFWQGNKYLLVRDAILATATQQNPRQLIAETGTTNDKTGEKLFSVLEYEAIAEQLDAEGNIVGHRVTLTDQTVRRFSVRAHDPYSPNYPAPFGNWVGVDGRRAAKISQFVSMRGDPRRILLQLLLSGVSNNLYPTVYSTYGRTHGLAVTPAAVDVDGILSFPLPRGLRNLSAFRHIKEIPAKQALHGWLVAAGAAVVMRLVEGVQKITLVHCRPTARADVQHALRDRDWYRRPSVQRKDDKQSTWVVRLNWDTADRKYRRIDRYLDSDVVDAKHGAQSKPIELKIRGLYTQSSAGTLGVFQGLRARFGVDAMTVAGSTSWKTAQYFSVGDLVSVSASDVIDLSGSTGITAQSMQIAKIRKDPVKGTVDLTLVYTAANSGGYAPVFTVIVVNDADTVSASFNDYSAPAVSDLAWFLVNQNLLPLPAGVPVELVHIGQEENNTLGNITALDLGTGVVTIVGHNLTAGDRVRVVGWDQTLTHLKKFVHLASAGAGIGAGNDPFFTYGV